jgi:glyoxylase-like metal-dependent hydrolase (beta-lactamase superfamily II)
MQTILVDTGIGSKEPENNRDTYGLNSSKLLKGLKNLGLTARDVDVVILTHLHFDHSGGSTKLDTNGKAIPAFPKATYFVQRAAWEEACSPNERGRSYYNSDDFEPLLNKGQLEFLDGDTEVIPGVWAQVTNGHCKGHQLVKVNPSGERVAFPGDLIPTPHHVDLSCITALDYSPEDTLYQKRDFLSLAEKEGWLVIFGHGYEHRAGYIERKNGNGTWRCRPTEV